jgi:hypothetical protein
VAPTPKRTPRKNLLNDRPRDDDDEEENVDRGSVLLNVSYSPFGLLEEKPDPWKMPGVNSNATKLHYRTCLY